MTLTGDQNGSSTSAEQSSTPVQGEARDLVLARRDPATGLIVVPTPVEGNPLEFKPGARFLTEEQFMILGPLGIKREYDPGAVINFLNDAHSRGFDPWAKEIYLMRYKGLDGWQYVHHIGIHGMTRHANDTGLFGGVPLVRYCGDDGKWLELWPYRDAAPFACKVDMIRRDWEDRISNIGYYDEFAPLVDEKDKDGARTGNKIPAPMWRASGSGGKPTIMLKKCAKALDFREGWSSKFGNWYVREEFEKAEVEGLNIAAAERDQRRQAAYADAQRRTVDAVDIGAEVTDDTMPADRVRAMLLAELDAQAAIIGRPTSFMVARWQETRNRPWDTATLSEIAAHVQNCRPHIVTALRSSGRAEMADRYADAPMPGTLADLFGADPRLEQAAAA